MDGTRTNYLQSTSRWVCCVLSCKMPVTLNINYTILSFHFVILLSSRVQPSFPRETTLASRIVSKVSEFSKFPSLSMLYPKQSFW